jgi:hypothetical protein
MLSIDRGLFDVSDREMTSRWAGPSAGLVALSYGEARRRAASILDQPSLPRMKLNSLKGLPADWLSS